MATYYHVCERWDGSYLESLYSQHGDAAYDMFAERWPEAAELAAYHAHCIHLHANLDEAAEYARLRGGDVLLITDENDVLDIATDSIEYPHPICYCPIPAALISRV